VLLPFLAFLFVVAVDWGRIFYYSITCENCARNGAMWLADPIIQQNSPYKNVTDAATADAGDLSPTPTVTSTTGTDAYGQSYVEVTVTYTFTTVTTFPGVPNTTPVTRTVRMYPAPQVPL
jgi:hypothetical protein